MSRDAGDVNRRHYPRRTGRARRGAGLATLERRVGRDRQEGAARPRRRLARPGLPAVPAAASTSFTRPALPLNPAPPRPRTVRKGRPRAFCGNPA